MHQHSSYLCEGRSAGARAGATVFIVFFSEWGKPQLRNWGVQTLASAQEGAEPGHSAGHQPPFDSVMPERVVLEEICLTDATCSSVCVCVCERKRERE